MTDPGFDVEAYVATATEYAVGGVRGGLESRHGRLDEVESWSDEHGYWLRVTASLSSRPGIVIRSARLLVDAGEPDTSAELAGQIYGIAFEERLDTKLHVIEPVDGVITF